MHNNMLRGHVYSFILWTLGLLSLFGAIPVQAHHTADHAPPILRTIGFDQRLDEQVPLDLTFHDETGNRVALRRYFGERPVILALVYYECPRLCTLVLNGLLKSLRALSFDAGDQFNVVTVSFDSTETPGIAAAKKDAYVQRYGRLGAEGGWHFLTGPDASIQRLTQAVGFRYVYDPERDEYAHATGIIVLTPQGKIARYFYGLEYSARDLRLGLVEATASKIGSPVDQALLYCLHYDPETGKYGLIIMNVLRLAGVATVLTLGTFIFMMSRRKTPTTGQSW